MAVATHPPLGSWPLHGMSSMRCTVHSCSRLSLHAFGSLIDSPNSPCTTPGAGGDPEGRNFSRPSTPYHPDRVRVYTYGVHRTTTR